MKKRATSRNLATKDKESSGRVNASPLHSRLVLRPRPKLNFPHALRAKTVIVSKLSRRHPEICGARAGFGFGGQSFIQSLDLLLSDGAEER
jgi:hypothetical protein